MARPRRTLRWRPAPSPSGDDGPDRRPPALETKPQLAAAGADAEMAVVIRDLLATRYATVVPLVERGVADGHLRAGVDPGLLWQAIVNPMHLDAVRGLDTSDERARALVGLILSGARDR